MLTFRETPRHNVNYDAALIILVNGIINFPVGAYPGIREHKQFTGRLILNKSESAWEQMFAQWTPAITTIPLHLHLMLIETEKIFVRQLVC